MAIGKNPQRSDQQPSMRAALSMLTRRALFASRVGFGFDDKRDYYGALGYDRNFDPETAFEAMARGGIAKRVATAYPKTAWADPPRVFDVESADTPFNTAYNGFVGRFRLYTVLQKADILSGVGKYGVLLLGASGDYSTELARGDDILFMTPLRGKRASIEVLNRDVNSPRFGMPERYRLDLGDGVSKLTHWSRVLHLPSEDTLESALEGVPRLEPVWNYLDDIMKIVGGGAEGFWVNVVPGLQLDLDKDIVLDAAGEAALSDEVDEYIHNLRRVLRTRGAKANRLTGDVADGDSIPKALSAPLSLISGTTGIPVRLLIGSERGELASSQDRDNWAERIYEYRSERCSWILDALIDRLVSYGMLPEPSADVTILWSKSKALTIDERADVAQTLANANSAQVAAGDTIVMTSDEMRAELFGLSPQRTMISAAAVVPHWERTTEIADESIDQFSEAFLTYWDEVGRSLQEAVDADNGTTMPELDLLADESLATDVSDLLLSVLNKSGLESAAIARSRGSYYISSEDIPPVSSNNIVARFARCRDHPIIAAGRPIIAQVDASFNTNNPRSIEWAESHAGDLITEVSRETILGVRSYIEEGLRDGIPPRRLVPRIFDIVGLRSDQLAALSAARERLEAAEPGDRIKVGTKTVRVPASGASVEWVNKQSAAYAKRLRKQRALLIARTETIPAANRGIQEFWLQGNDRGDIPGNARKAWIVTPDDRLREAHARMAGTIVNFKDEFVLPDGRKMLVPSDFNERCTIGLLPPE